MKFFALKCFSYFLNLLPNRLLLLAGDMLGLVWFYAIPFRRKIVIQNLTLAYGNSKTPKAIETLAAKNFRHYGRTMLESMRSVMWTVSDFRKNVIFEGREHLEPYLKEKKGGFLVSMHLGPWEVCPGSFVAQNVPVDVVTKVQANQEASAMLNWFRTRLGVEIIPASRSKHLIIDSIARGRFIGFMIDQFMGPPVGIPVKFFGQTAGTTVSLALLSEQQGCPILFCYVHRDARGRLHNTVEPLDFPKFSEDFNDRLWEKTQFINDRIEAKIREYPEQWMWLHRRWKPFVGVPKWQKSGIATLAPTS